MLAGEKQAEGQQEEKEFSHGLLDMESEQ